MVTARAVDPALPRAARRRPMLAGLAALLACAALLALIAPSAHAGEWMQVSCVNPNGSAAPSEGWSAHVQDTGYGTSASAACGPGSPMVGDLSSAVAEPVGSAAWVQYAPPAGSTLIGGTLNVYMAGDSYGYNASGDAVIYEPAMAYPTDVRMQCAYGLAGCSANHDFTGTFTLPADLGGDLFVSASCGGDGGESCNTGGSHGAWSLVQVKSAQLLLRNDAVPTATGFSGTVLDRRVRGTAHLILDAFDTGGPGVYLATVDVDGTPVWSGTPNTDDGACVAVGRDAGTGALMFDHQQPCPQTVAAQLPVPTAGLPDGNHELSVSVTDAAGNTSPVFDRTITTSNPQLTPKPGRGVKARFELSWRWKGARTVLRSITVRKLPRTARVRAHCSGRHCPKLKVKTVRAKRVRTLLRELGGRTFRAGNHLLITVTAPHRRTERIQLTIRAGHKPIARLVKR